MRDRLPGALLSRATSTGVLTVWPDGPEVELPAGDVTVGVVRIGETVRRPHQASSAGVQRRRLRLLLDGYGRDAVSAELLLDACALRFAGVYDSMRWAAENLGGGRQRMWDEGAGDTITRRVQWFAEVCPELAAALGLGGCPAVRRAGRVRRVSSDARCNRRACR